MKVVLDTNVLISGLLKVHGVPGEIVRLVASGRLLVCYDSAIFAEYEEVLARPEFGFDPKAVGVFLDVVRDDGFLVTAGPLAEPLPDPDDEPFLAVALAARAECLVTGNLRHFPQKFRKGMKVFSPGDFLDWFRKTGL